MPARPLTAVIINDQKMLRDLLKMIFKEHGITVVASFTVVVEGVVYIRKGPLAFILIEMIMPVLGILPRERERH